MRYVIAIVDGKNEIQYLDVTENRPRFVPHSKLSSLTSIYDNLEDAQSVSLHLSKYIKSLIIMRHPNG